MIDFIQCSHYFMLFYEMSSSDIVFNSIHCLALICIGLSNKNKNTFDVSAVES